MELAQGVEYLLGLYVFGFVTSIAYLHTLNRRRTVGRTQTWAQLLVDFSVVALTVSFTHGPDSFFTFMFIVVVLEAGLLLELRQSFVFATLASAFMLEQWIVQNDLVRESPTFEHLYNFLVQCLALYLTAFIASYWNQRVNHMKAFQREIVDNMNSGFLIADTEGRILLQNKAADAMLGIPNGSAIGLEAGEVLKPDTSNESPIITALQRQEDFNSYEFRTALRNGSTIPLGLTTNRIRGRNDEVTGIIASFTDLTEINRMREEARKHDRMAVIGELAAGLAHEVRNPLTVIRGAVDELQVNRNEGPVQDRLQGMILRESHHLNEIVSGFLDFARNPSTERELFDLGELVDEITMSLEQEYGGFKSLSIECNSPHHLPPVSGDQGQIRQVLINLAKNGIEAMEGEGTLRITTVHDKGRIEVRFDDEGPGIGPSDTTRIFEPFFTTKESGVGMGLAVCLRIITAHDGNIEAVSRHEGGCTMRVSLPVSRENSNGKY